MRARSGGWRLRLSWLLAAAVAGSLGYGSAREGLVRAQEPDEMAAQESLAQPMVLDGGTGTMEAPQAMGYPMTAEPYEPTADQKAASREFMETAREAWAARKLPVSQDATLGPFVGLPSPGSTTEARASRPETALAPAPAAPGTFVNYLVRALAPPAGYTSVIAEPALSQSGRYVWYTHNWHAARSTNGGSTWSYVNPYADFPSFCCDQDTVYDRGRDIYLWYRQGVVPSGATQNQFKLSVSGDNAASWCTYTVSPTGVESTWTERWFDYPHLALSNNYLYITTNLFRIVPGPDVFDRMVLLRWPLDALEDCAGFDYTFWNTSTGWSWTPTDGATETMYLGDHRTTSRFFVYAQPESSTSLSAVTRTIPAWTATNGDGNCPVAGGANPCARADQRIISGWVRRAQSGNEIGFFWNVRQGAGFPYPYVNAATFREDNRAYKGRPYIWNESYAFHWAAGHPNDRGDLGVAVTVFRPDSHPFQNVGIDDDYNGTPPGWELAFSRGSNAALTSNAWGDYVRVRSHAPQGVAWVASGHTIQANRGSTPHFVRFGRERDLRGVNRFVNR
jgi:hypothetical protein